jgi:peptidyl-prolyl cis-trans isomerase A (cyclophilin A)
MSVLVSAFAVTAIKSFNASAADDPKASSNPIVEMKTSMGTIKIELFQDKAPITVKNFLGYVDDKFYDGTVFHRVMDGFMIQGGGFTREKQQKKTKSPIKNEAANGLKNDRGTLAMARTGDPNSATSQFFINHKNNEGLNRPNPDGHGYAVFGKVIEGMDIVDKIAKVETKPNPDNPREKSAPVTTLLIESVRRVEKKAETKTQSK